MKNPLNRRFLRELKSDLAKYLIIFIFLLVFAGAMSGYFCAQGSVLKVYTNSHEELNLEDGPISFNIQPEEQILKTLEEDNALKFTQMYYKEETIEENDDNLRIYADRESVDLVSIYDGDMPQGKGEIALDRMYAQNNDLKIGDTITVNDQEFKITGTIALPDYSALYENNNDMMFDSVNFGVAIMSKEGYEAFDSAHEIINYAWQYDVTPADDNEANERFEDFTDSLEEVLKKYDQDIVQAQVAELYDKAEALSDELTDKMEEASDEITEKIEAAGTAAYIKMMADPTADMDELIAQELGTTKQAYTEMTKAFEDADSIMDDLESDASESHEIDFDELENADDYENDMSFSLDGIRDIIDKIDATGIIDTEEIYSLIDSIEELADYEIDDSEFLTVDACLPEYSNQAVRFVGTDGSSDRATGQIMTYIIMAIIAFLFAITTSNTIAKEAPVIGTLRASGYTKGEIVRHYMVLPIAITILGCGIGNILGYTVFLDAFKNVYYNSYSLPKFEAYFSADAFIQTTLIPLGMTIVINLVILIVKMRLKPLKFLRGELKKNDKRASAMKLSVKLPFFARFRLRILFQNIPSYIVLVVGIIMAGTLAVFGFMFLPLIEDYGKLIDETKICEYQYVLMDQIETENEQAEKFCMTSLETTLKDYLTDDVSIYGVEDNSSYIKADIPEGQVLVSNAAAEKFKLKAGDEFVVKEKYTDKTYTFIVAGEYTYDAAIAVFMPREDYLETFDEDEDYFTGYFSNEILSDIDEDDVATIIDTVSLSKIVSQLTTSFGSFMMIFQVMGAGIFILLMFILTKQIIEKNLKSISMTKILGFTNGEIGRLYLIITSIVVIVALAASVPLIDLLLRFIMSTYMYTEMSGYLPYIVSSSCYIKTIIMGIICYVIVAFIMMIKIRRVPKGEILKNQSL